MVSFTCRTTSGGRLRRGGRFGERACMTSLLARPVPSLSDMGEMRVPCHFPQEAVGIGEVAGVAAPVRVMPGLHETAAVRGDVGQQRVDLRPRGDVVGEGEGTEARAL